MRVSTAFRNYGPLSGRFHEALSLPVPGACGGLPLRYARDLRPLAAGSARRKFFPRGDTPPTVLPTTSRSVPAALSTPPHRLGSPVERERNRARKCGARRRGSPEREAPAEPAEATP